MEPKNCSTCGCETTDYEVVHSAVLCHLCEYAMVLTDMKDLQCDGKLFWVSCSHCGNPGPARPSAKAALEAALAEGWKEWGFIPTTGENAGVRFPGIVCPQHPEYKD